MAFDRYKDFRVNGQVGFPPAVSLTKKSTDFFETYRRGQSRLDLISYDYYKDANYDWLILMANPEYGALEYEITDGSELRIPYPLDITLEDLSEQIKKYKILYGE